MGKQYTAAQFMEAIPGTGGIITAIARRVGCRWHTARNFIERHPTVRQVWQDEQEAILDLAETKAIEAVKDGDGPMIRWYLSTKGKSRGYTERQEVTGAGGNELVFRVVYGDDRDKDSTTQATPEAG